MEILSSSRRTLICSLPSWEIQLPKSRSCTLRVGLDVIGTSYSQAVKARMHRLTAIPKPDRRQIKFEEGTAGVQEPAQLLPQLFGELRRYHVNLLDRMGFRQNLRRFFFQGLRDLAIQVRIAARVICERVKNTVCGRSNFNGEP